MTSERLGNRRLIDVMSESEKKTLLDFAEAGGPFNQDLVEQCAESLRGISPPWISLPEDSREAIRQAMITRIREARDQWKVGGKRMKDPARSRIVGIVDALQDFNRKEGQR